MRLSPFLLISAALVWLAPAAILSAAPDLVFRGRTVLDTLVLGGDNDRAAEPGETFELRLTLGNEGNDVARLVTATLISNDADLVVNPNPISVSFPDLAVNALESSLGAGFELTAVALAPCGKPVALDLQLRYEDSGGTPFLATVRFLLFLGEGMVLAREDFDTGPGGWQPDAFASTGLSGGWVNAAPEPYLWAGVPAQPGRDVTYPDVSCYYTGQNLNPATPEVQNVDLGTQVLRSRIYDLSGASNVYASFARWFYTDDPGTADRLTVEVSSDGGGSWTPMQTITAVANRWTPVAYHLDPLIPLGPTTLFRLIAEDAGPASVCEAAIDDFALERFSCNVDPAEPRLESSSPSIDDSIDPMCSDGDNLADAGETVDFTVLVENLGTAPATNTLVTLRPPLPAELTLIGPNPVAIGLLADNGGSALATFRLQVADPVNCQTAVMLPVDITADLPFQATNAIYDLVLEEDISQPLLSWFDDFDSGFTPWSIILYGTSNDWAPGAEDCARNPGTPPTPARNFWYTGTTGVPTDCQVNPYGPNDDSAIRSPLIDTGFTRPLLLTLSWNQLLTMTPGDADAAEVWIDHDDDGNFTRVARYQGQVTTNGDTLDEALIDLQNNPEGADLSNTAQRVRLELRFLSDATGGGGTPLALGWIVDNVRLRWTDADGRSCDNNVCAFCQSQATITPSATQACTGVTVVLDGRGSGVSNCPAPGVAQYDWFREGLPFQSGVTSVNVSEPTAATYTYRLQVSCSTDPVCTASASQPLVIVDCPGCAATATINPAPTDVCAGTPVDLDASMSSIRNCAGTQDFQWWRDGQPIPGATMATYTAVEPGPGTFTYLVRITCSTEPTCQDARDHVLQVRADGTPLAVGNTLRARRVVRDVELTWIDPQVLAESWLVERAISKAMSGNPLPSATSVYVDPLAVDAIDDYFYAARAVSCSGIVGP